MHTSRTLSYIFFFILTAGFFFGFFSFAHAGFGITPPYVKNERLTRGSTFEQRIVLVRSDPLEDLRTEITVNVPGINDWFSIDLGETFILEKGQTQVPINIRVRVPSDADFGVYDGVIRIRTSPLDVPEGGGVSIALGAQIDVGLEVVDKIFDFEVRRLRMADLEEGHRQWGLFFPGKVRLFMTIENTGNAVYGPSRVVLEIYDNRGEELLETLENKNKLRQIEPFAAEEIIAEFPTKLPAGKYLAKYSIYRGSEVAAQGELNLSIAPFGLIPDYEGYGFGGLGAGDKAKVIGTAIGLLGLLVALFAFTASTMRRRRRRMLHN